jgi:hypothetical protein
MQFALQECVGESTIFIYFSISVHRTAISDLTLMRSSMFAFLVLFKPARFMVISTVFSMRSHYSHFGLLRRLSPLYIFRVLFPFSSLLFNNLVCQYITYNI